MTFVHAFPRCLLFLASSYMVCLIAKGGLAFDLGPLHVQSEKVIIPGMLVWLLALLVSIKSGGKAPRESAPAQQELHPPMRVTPVRILVVVAGSASLAWLAVARGFDHPLHCDDFSLIRHALSASWKDLHAGLLTTIWGFPGSGFLRPVPDLSWFLSVRLLPVSPHWLYLENYSIHVLTSCIVGLAAARLGRSGATGLFALFLFAVFGAHVEPPMWLVCRYDLMATLFSVLAIWLFTLSLESNRPWFTVGSTLSLLAALLSKESSLAMPFALATVAVARGHEPSLLRRVGRAWSPLCALLLVLAFRLWTRGGLGGYTVWPDIEPVKLILLPLTPLAPLTWPINVAMIRDLWWGARVVVGVGLALIPYLAVHHLRTAPRRTAILPYACLLWATVPVFSVLSLSHTLDQSRYLYLPASMFSIVVACLLDFLPPRRATLLCSLIVACHFALLRMNSEPRVIAGHVQSLVYSQMPPVVKALRKGETVCVLGLPEAFRGAPLFAGGNLGKALEFAHGVPHERLYDGGLDGREVPPTIDRTFRWNSPDTLVDETRRP
ncbi:MAG: hypothetical protein HY815_12575 [Candidatus Riflebacteria bacterium]|nr:hypothetical protein [Candidatus Riflebacteria bacterium]